MVGASKILTVSYGTFSCTLEGFDDPFSTMKAIAEYFRDLAADDRYFGAEPPQPDAAMLHQIAEREIQRRVEAKIQENGIVLRAGGARAGAAEAAPRPGDATAEPRLDRPARQLPPGPAPDAQTPPAPVSRTTAARPPAAEPEEEAGDLVGLGDSVAAKLLRIRAAVAQSRAADSAPETPAHPEAATAAPPVEEEYVEDELEPGDAEPLSAFGAPRSLNRETPALDADADDMGAAYAEPAGEAAHGADRAEAADGADRAEAADAIPPEEWDENGAVPEEALSEQAEETVAPESLTRSWVPAREWAPEPEAETETAETEESDAGPFDTAEDEPEVADPEWTRGLIYGEAETGQVPEESTGYDSESEEDDDAFRSAPSAMEVADKVKRARARMIRVNQAEADQSSEAADADRASEDAPGQEDRTASVAWRDEHDEEQSDEAEAARPEMPAQETGRRAEADRSEHPREDAAETPAAAAEGKEPGTGHEAKRAGRSILEDNAAHGDESVNRLMRQTDTEFEGAENRRRFETIAHLKAAVAARVADRWMGRDKARNEDAEISPYREDLAKAVRPRTPAAPEGRRRAPRPAGGDRPAPLVLVSEQRIDQPSPQMGDHPDIRPRRVNTGNLAVDEASYEQEPDARNIFSDTNSFAEFAERVGATTLPDILEAAAAYAECVEGRPHFTRPQLIRAAVDIRAEGMDDFSREAGLRSFGTLLREGKIRKIKRGQFAISQSSRFIQEARKIAR